MENRQAANPDFQLNKDSIISNIGNDNSLIDPLLIDRYRGRDGGDEGDGGDGGDAGN